MHDGGDELEEIKREIVESRALTIKTNNLVNGLAADIHSISRRQQGYERSSKINGIGFYALVLVLVLIGAKMVVDARVDAERARAKDHRDQVARLEKEIKILQSREERRTQAERRASEFQSLIDSHQRALALERWPEVSRAALTPTERQAFQRAVERFRNELSLLEYQAGLEHIRARRWHEAEISLRSSLSHQGDAAHSPEARFQLARSLRTLGQQREAISLLIQLVESSADREVLDDATLLLAEAQIDAEAWNDAKSTLRTFLRRFPNSALGGRARSELAKLRLYH